MWPGVRCPMCHGHLGRTEKPAVQEVPFAALGQNRPFGLPLPRDHGDRLVKVRVERLPHGGNLLQPELPELGENLIVRHPHAGEEDPLRPRCAGWGNRPFQLVQEGQDREENPFVAEGDDRLLLPGYPFSVVVELRPEVGQPALHPVEFIPLLPGGDLLLPRFLRLREALPGWVAGILRRIFFLIRHVRSLSSRWSSLSACPIAENRACYRCSRRSEERRVWKECRSRGS